MKKLFFVANWKSNKTESEVKDWFQQFTVDSSKLVEKEVIICPPFPYLPLLKSLIINHKSPLKLGAQNISRFDEGAYTGEVNGKQLKEYVGYILIGHSERRKNFSETNNGIRSKIEQAKNHHLVPIVCVSEITELEPLKDLLGKDMVVAYEPLFAIGTGSADTPENANEMAKKIKSIADCFVIYGGSVNSSNVQSFTSMSDIDGVLPGKASLDPSEFKKIIESS